MTWEVWDGALTIIEWGLKRYAFGDFDIDIGVEGFKPVGRVGFGGEGKSGGGME